MKFLQQFSDELESLVAKAMPAVVAVQHAQGHPRLASTARRRERPRARVTLGQSTPPSCRLEVSRTTNRSVTTSGRR